MDFVLSSSEYKMILGLLRLFDARAAQNIEENYTGAVYKTYYVVYANSPMHKWDIYLLMVVCEGIILGAPHPFFVVVENNK